jgi:hypothetical protein
MIIKVVFHIPMKLKYELARASMTTSDVNNQWRSNFQQQSKSHKRYNAANKIYHKEVWGKCSEKA